MKEIKFRVWHKPTKQFVKQDIFYLDEPSSIGQLSVGLDGTLSRLSGMDYEVSAHVSDPEDYAIQQYTGFKDNNDQEIYEGDILLWEAGWMYPEMNGEIQWIENGYHFVQPEYDVKWLMTRKSLSTPKIIGNIFEGADK